MNSRTESFLHPPPFISCYKCKTARFPGAMKAKVGLTRDPRQTKITFSKLKSRYKSEPGVRVVYSIYAKSSRIARARNTIH